MDSLRIIIDFLSTNFFCDIRSSILSVCAIMIFIFLFKLLKGKEDKVGKNLAYVIGCLSFIFLFSFVY